MGWEFWDIRSRRRRCLSVLFVVLSVSLIGTAVFQESRLHAFNRIADLASDFFFSSQEVPLQTSCLSRNESSSYMRPSSHQMSAYLLSKLRSYEDLHRRCGPNTGPYNHTLRYLNDLESNHNAKNGTECRYVGWTSFGGLGNGMVTLASTFLYALLTDRVLLVDFDYDMGELFCEPFSNSSWIMPRNFPYKSDKFLHLQTLQTAVQQEQQRGFRAQLPSFLLVNLRNTWPYELEVFHCDQTHNLVLQKVPVVVIKSDLYFAPKLFITPCFVQELKKMFPEKETVFHHLGRYLFHPSDAVWKQIVKYYRDYKFDQADAVKVGLQIRVVDHDDVPEQVVMNQILNCTQGHNVLPYLAQPERTDSTNQTTISSGSSKVVVLVTSLFRYYGDHLKAMYQKKKKKNSGGAWVEEGNEIEIHQPSSDGYQKMGNRGQNMRALMEMYLLSMCDLLVTTGESTFGYVAQSLGGLKPWVLRKQDKHTSERPACHRAVTIDPCLHCRPRYDCKTKRLVDRVTKIFPYIKVCEDRAWWGVRLSDGT